MNYKNIPEIKKSRDAAAQNYREARKENPKMARLMYRVTRRATENIIDSLDDFLWRNA